MYISLTEFWVEVDYADSCAVEWDFATVDDAAMAIGRRVWPWSKKKWKRGAMDWPDGSEGWYAASRRPALPCSSPLAAKPCCPTLPPCPRPRHISASHHLAGC